MDYNPNLIKTVNDSLATLGISSGPPVSQALGGSDAQAILCYRFCSTKTKRHNKATTSWQPLNSLQPPDLGIDFLFLALNKASNFLTTKMLSPGSLHTARSGAHRAAGSPLRVTVLKPLGPAQLVSWEVCPSRPKGGVPESSGCLQMMSMY